MKHQSASLPPQVCGAKQLNLTRALLTIVMTNPPVQPIYIMPENTQRSSGKSAQRNNILAAKLVAETVRTTLGPKGMDKMLVDSLGTITVTNDGVTILQEMHIEHPAARMIVEVAKTQEHEVGDGTTTAVILAGELLANAEALLDQKIHPTVIIKGYRAAADKALETIHALAKPVTLKDTALLTHVAATAMTGKGAEAAREHLASLAVNAVRIVASATRDGAFVDRGAVSVQSAVGAPIGASRLIEGIVLDKEVVHPSMPRTIENAKILVLDTSLEVKDLETDAKVSITDPKQLKAFFDVEDAMLRALTDAVISSGANVVFCQKGIDDLAAYHLAKAGVLAVRRVKKSDIEALAKASGASVLSDTNDIVAGALGAAALVTERRLGENILLFVEGCTGAKAVTLLARGGTSHVVEEVTRALTDAIGDLKAVIEEGSAVAGAGATEVALARAIASYAQGLTGRERLAVEAFATSLEVVPRTLAENAGLDPIDILTDLKAAHATSNTSGVDVNTGKTMDAWARGVIEPVRIKTQAIASATDVATMILRIDDVIASGEAPSEQGNSGGYDQ
jgi:thermosome